MVKTDSLRTIRQALDPITKPLGKTGERRVVKNPIHVEAINDREQFERIRKDFFDTKDHSGKSMQEVYREWLRNRRRG